MEEKSIRDHKYSTIFKNINGKFSPVAKSSFPLSEDIDVLTVFEDFNVILVERTHPEDENTKIFYKVRFKLKYKRYGSTLKIITIVLETILLVSFVQFFISHRGASIENRLKPLFMNVLEKLVTKLFICIPLQIKRHGNSPNRKFSSKLISWYLSIIESIKKILNCTGAAT